MNETQSHKLEKSKGILAGLVLFVWLVGCAFVFWWFQFRYLGAYDQHADDQYWASFLGDSLVSGQLLPTQGQALVVHFVDPDCPCSRFAVPHIAELEQQFSADVEFIHFTTEASEDERMQFLKTLAVPAGPAVAVINNVGELAYFGPYSGGEICGEGKDFVTTTLDSLKSDFNPRWVNQEAVGCFCQWPNYVQQGSIL